MRQRKAEAVRQRESRRDRKRERQRVGGQRDSATKRKEGRDNKKETASKATLLTIKFFSMGDWTMTSLINFLVSSSSRTMTPT